MGKVKASSIVYFVLYVSLSQRFLVIVSVVYAFHILFEIVLFVFRVRLLASSFCSPSINKKNFSRNYPTIR